MEKEMRVSDNTAISMPMRNLISILAAVGLGIWFAFGVIERLNNVETNYKLVSSDLEKNTDFRIKWPRGELGSLPADSEQFMLIEHMAGQIEKIQEQLEAGMHNKVNIDFLSKQVEKLLLDVEKLKDKIRANGSTH
tara:strand:- start:510 stop:917 length:408 start_codon:yes stop_codon:yes gene_type:complete